jgi:hypothetical protein
VPLPDHIQAGYPCLNSDLSPLNCHPSLRPGKSDLLHGALPALGACQAAPARMRESRIAAQDGRAPGAAEISQSFKSKRLRLDSMSSVSEKAVLRDAPIKEIELDAKEIKELDELAERTRKCGISWEDLKAELGL